MDEQRIYQKKVDINTQHVLRFYNDRAERNDMESPYTSVLLADGTDKAEKWDLFETKSIFPQLKIEQGSRVLDVGCGVGRWAEKIIPMLGGGVLFRGRLFFCDDSKSRKSLCQSWNIKL